MENVLKLLEIISPILLLLLTWIGVKTGKLIGAKVQNEYLKGVLVRLSETVFAAVKELQQTVVDAIKVANADGKITDDEKASIKAAAVKTIKSHLGVKGIKELLAVLGLDEDALDSFLGTQVEAAVLDLKAVKAVTAAVPS